MNSTANPPKPRRRTAVTVAAVSAGLLLAGCGRAAEAPVRRTGVVGATPSTAGASATDIGPSLADIDRALADLDTQLSDADRDVATPEGDIR